MGSITDAFENQRKRVLRESKYKIREIEINGKLEEPLICEKRIDRILAFKGTGEKRFFLELIKELDEMAINELTRAWDKGDYQHVPWIDEYIIQNNFQVVFIKGDLSLRYPSKAS